MAVRMLTAASVNRVVGEFWDLLVEVRDRCGAPIATDVPVLTIDLPDGETDTPPVESIGGGGYYVAHTLTMPGRHLATWTTVDNGTAVFAAYATDTVTGPGMPGLDDLRGDPEDDEDEGYLGPTSWTDAEVQDALDAEAAAQRVVCEVPAAFPADLRQALLRRVARNLALRKLPLAVLRGDADAGTPDTTVPGSDPEVRRLERPYRRLVIA